MLVKQIGMIALVSGGVWLLAKAIVDNTGVSFKIG